jgi:hypothetical protein
MSKTMILPDLQGSGTEARSSPVQIQLAKERGNHKLACDDRKR